MKNILLLLVAAIVLAAIPTARAYDKDGWHYADKTLHQLYVRMDAVKGYRDRYGASPRMRDQFAELRHGIDDLTAIVNAHVGDPKLARKRADNLSDLMSRLEDEYRDRAHDAGITIHIDR